MNSFCFEGFRCNALSWLTIKTLLQTPVVIALEELLLYLNKNISLMGYFS